MTQWTAEEEECAEATEIRSSTTPQHQLAAPRWSIPTIILLYTWLALP